MCAKDISINEKLTMMQLFGFNVPFPEASRSVAVSAMILYERPIYYLFPTSNEVDGDSNLSTLYMFVLCLFICTAADQIVILAEKNIFQNMFLSFNFMSIQFHYLSYSALDNIS